MADTERTFPISDVLRMIGDDNVMIQNVLESLEHIRTRGKGRDKTTVITFATNPQFMTPDAVFHDNSQYIGLIVWFKRSDYIKARDEWDRQHASTGESSDGKNHN